jgi:two-component system, sensor histidine kinase and response regulator
MIPEKPFTSEIFDNNRPANDSAYTVESEIHSEESKVVKNRVMMRIHQLERKNDELKDIIELRQNEITDIITAHKKHISVLAHDLKSPLSTIYGVLFLIKKFIKEKNYKEIETFIDIASGSSLHTTNLIENIQSWAHSQGSEKQFSPIRINLAELVEQEVENTVLARKIKQISVSYTIQKEFMVRADLHMIKSVFRNLLSNAIKFTPTGGSIVISAKESDSFIEIMIKEDGMGIAPEIQQKLLLNTVTREGIPGKGFGLLICKEFVEIHGGNIWMESEPEKGSSFFFTMPADKK